jgi:hypothetical protein
MVLTHIDLIEKLLRLKYARFVKSNFVDIILSNGPSAARGLGKLLSKVLELVVNSSESDESWISFEIPLKIR